MENLSLHILDIAENSIRAGAEKIEIKIIENDKKDLLTVRIKDDGEGMDKEALEKAPWGSYDKRSLRNLSKIRAHLLFKYFTRFQDRNVDRYVLSDRARVLVTFKHHDVVSDSLNPGMDLVLCRNLLIYFQKELQEKALRNMHATLNPGGFLILGKTENIPLQMLDHFEVVDLRERIYRKK